MALARTLVADQFPAWASLPLRRVASSGTDNAIFRLGDELAIKLPRYADPAVHITREIEWVPWLAERVRWALPLPVAVGEPGRGFPFPWMAYEWVPGDVPGIRGGSEQLLTDDIGELVLALRALPVEGAPPSWRVHALRQEDAAARECVAAIADEFKPAALLAAWEESCDAPQWDGSPVWSHGDLLRTNLVVRDGRLTGLIDLQGVGGADPAGDLLIAWNFLDPAMRDRVHSALRVGAAERLRGRGWALLQALKQLPYYRGGRNDVLAASARRVVAEVIADSA